jgi:hypothetical protein
MTSRHGKYGSSRTGTSKRTAATRRMPGTPTRVPRQQRSTQPPAARQQAATRHLRCPRLPDTPTASREGSPPSPLPLLAGRIPNPQPGHHSTQMPQASTIQNQARARSRRPHAEHIGRVCRDKARHPVRQLHLQMRHPVHVPERVGPNPAPAQRMSQRRDHHLARQQGTETS